MKPDPGAPIVVVYDGQCRFCLRQMDWIRRRDRAGRFTFLPSQTPDLLERYPVLAGQDLSRGLRTVLPDGSACAGADAVYQIARRLGGYRWLAGLYRVPGLRALGRAAYAWIAARRYRLAGRCDAACALSPPEGNKNP